VIADLRAAFNRNYDSDRYARLLQWMEDRCSTRVEFRVAETPIFVPRSLLERMATEGARIAEYLISKKDYLSAARAAIPKGFQVAKETSHPHFLTADFALVRNGVGELEPRLVEIQAFPSVYAYQAVLCAGYREAYGLDPGLGVFLGGLSEHRYWKMLADSVLGNEDPENVVLTEVDPLHQKTRPDFEVTARKLGIAVVDITTLRAEGDRLYYRNSKGRLIPIRRIYNRAIADELIARKIELPFDLTRPWDVAWAGHPNWYFLISKFSIPWLTRAGGKFPVVPPAVFLNDFLEGHGRAELERAGVALPREIHPGTVYDQLLLKPLFSFAGRGIEFEPTQASLEAIAPERRKEYLLQQKMSFVPNIETPHGMTQAEIRILYLWAEACTLRPAISLVRLGRGKMMGVDHNKNQEWVGGSAAFYAQ
jgi:hypothetical protein